MMLTLSGGLDEAGAMAADDNLGNTVGSEEMVQDFVSIHMQGLLQPFSDRLQQLSAQVGELEGFAAAAGERAEDQQERLDRQERASAALEATAQESGSRLDKMSGELVAQKKEKMRLEGNSVETKASLAKARETLESLAASVATLREELQASNGRIGGLEVGLVDTEKRLTENMDARLDKQGRVCKEVTERSAEMLKACQQARALGENASAAVKKLQEATQESRKEDTGSLSDLGERVEYLTTKLAEVDQLTGSHSTGLQSMDREVQHLKAWTNQLKELGQMQKQHADLNSQLQEQARKLDLADQHIMNLEGGSGLRQLQDVELGNLKEAFAATSMEVKQLRKWQENMKTQGETLSSAGHRLDDLENNTKRVGAQAAVMEHDLQAFLAWREGAARKLDEHGSSLQQARTDLRQLVERVDTSSSQLQGLKGELTSEHEQLTKLGGKVELCCRYFNGLGKGLQDAHRQVNAAEGGVLPPKAGGAGGTALPALPRTPRVGNASAVVATPRRARSVGRVP